MENVHITSSFDKDLGEIKARVVKMGTLVASQLSEGMLMLANPDAARVEALVKNDRKVNGMNTSIAKHAERLIALRQPMALDLREALSPINIATELERIGDHAKSAAKRSQKMLRGAIPPEFQALLSAISGLLQTQIDDVLRAYDKSDLALAAHVREQDRQVDDLNRKVFELSVLALSDGKRDAATLMNVVLVSRNLERVGDHIVNIARYVNQIVTGDDLKATE